MVGLLCAAGLYAAWQLPISVFPQTDFPRVVIIVDNGEAPASQTLVSVTRPIEEAMNGIPGIARIKSKTARGSSEISLFFDWNGNILQELQLVQARLSQLAPSLPPTAQIRNVERLTFAVFPVVGYSLVSDNRDEASLRDVATFIIRPRLSRLPGIATVGVAGGKVREFHVIIDPDRLVAHNVSAQQVVDAVHSSNIIVSPGLIDENHQLELALISGQAKKPEELNGIVVATVNNAPVTLADVPTVGAGVDPQYTMVTADGHTATLININRQPDANTVAVVDEVKAELAAMRNDIPKDVRIAPYYDQSLLVRDSINSVRDSILIGLLLSVAILYAFLRNWGTTFVAILVIPVTILITFLAMWFARLSFDLMTMGGVAASIGLVIDDAIVVVENIYTHINRGESRREAVLRAIIRRYEWVLSHALDNRWLVLVTIAGVLVGSFLIYRSLGSEFLPEFDESAFVLDYWAPPGSSLTETDRMLRHVEDLLMKTPEIESYSRRTGLEMGLFVTEPNRGDFAVKLKPGHKRGTDDVISDLRKQIEESQPALEIEFVGIVPDVIGDLQGNPEPIEIKLFSEDAAALQDKADEVETAIKKISGVVDTKNGVVVSGPAVTFKIDPQRASRFGVDAKDIADTVETAMSGNAASFILQQDRLIAVRVIFPANLRSSLDRVRALQVRSSAGTLFRLDQVADIQYEKGQTEISRENLRQNVAVTGRLEGKDLGTAINEIKTVLPREAKLPPAMMIEDGGLCQEQQ